MVTCFCLDKVEGYGTGVEGTLLVYSVYRLCANHCLQLLRDLFSVRWCTSSSYCSRKMAENILPRQDSRGRSSTLMKTMCQHVRRKKKTPLLEKSLEHRADIYCRFVSDDGIKRHFTRTALSTALSGRFDSCRAF